MGKDTFLHINGETNITYDMLLATSLPCPFCGQKPTYKYGYAPSYIEFNCIIENCYV
jgi:hypothetical protein